MGIENGTTIGERPSFAKATEDKPNFLFLITDQFHPGCPGYAGHPVVRTPNIDALAAGGVTFTRAYSNAPLSMPAPPGKFASSFAPGCSTGSCRRNSRRPGRSAGRRQQGDSL